MTSITDEEGSIQKDPPQAQELKFLKDENERNIIERPFSETHYPFIIKPSFSLLESIVETSIAESKTSFTLDDGIRELLGFDPVVLYEKLTLSPNTNDKLSFDIILLEIDLAQKTIFESKRSGIIGIFAMDVDPGYQQ